MLGCIGVAPAGGESVSAATSGPHGGNMDYRSVRQGTIVYLPVFEPGALLLFGDGHALQGDGEVTGQGIEISMDVELTVWLHRSQPIAGPRAEDDTFLMALGNAGGPQPLEDALRLANGELLRWLQADYGLDYRAASLLLGLYVRYDVGNVVDPAYTLVAKIEKRRLYGPSGRQRGSDSSAR
jgi:acetamidase/formamidase